MTRDETVALLGILRIAYPNFYRDSSKEDASKVVKLWASYFKEEPAELVTAAVRSMIATRTEGWPPNIAEIKAKIQSLTNPEELSDGEAWALVEKACRNGIYGYVEEYAKLPQVVQKTVGSANQLREWAIMDADELKTVVASNFQRSYRAILKREKERMMIPADVREMIADMQGQPTGTKRIPEREGYYG